MKKPPLDRNSAQKWLTVLDYGQFWNSRKTPALSIIAFYIVAVLNYGRNNIHLLVVGLCYQTKAVLGRK